MFAVIRYSTSRLQDLANSLRYICTTVRAAAAVQLPIVQLSNLTKRKSSWGLKTHWDACDCSLTPCIEISSVFPKYLRQTLLDRHRLPTDANLMSSLRSEILALWKQKSALWRKGGVEPDRWSLVRGFFSLRRKRKTRKEGLARYSTLQKLLRMALAVGESPQGCGHFLNTPLIAFLPDMLLNKTKIFCNAKIRTSTHEHRCWSSAWLPSAGS